MSPIAMAVRTAGDFYNDTMERWFGDYRLSHTIEFVHGGEPPWLEWLHRTYEDAGGEL
jgi:hypothetical protein